MNRELSEGDRERILFIVDEGKNSEYWAVLKRTLTEWKEREERSLKRFSERGLRESDISDFNRAVDRIDLIQDFMKINEELIEFNTSILQNLKKVMKETYSNVESFVKEVASGS